VRQRFAIQHGDLTADGIRTVEAATRQWFRLVGRRPKAKLSMPSVVVDDMWHELVLHTRDYAAFCEDAFGRFLHHVPESAMSSPAAAANRSTDLLNTLRLARHDEGGGLQRLPLLFRVDEELAVAGGRRYLADCGGRASASRYGARCACSISAASASRCAAGAPTARPARPSATGVPATHRVAVVAATEPGDSTPCRPV
jgi:hypothetical protein